MRHRARFLPAALLCFSVAGGAFAAEAPCEAEMTRASARHDVPLGILYAVALTETGRRGRLHPHALNIEGRSVFPTDRAAALRELAAARGAGRRLIDIGCMQVNHHFHRQAFASTDDMFDPRANVDYAARFLRDLRARHGSWTMAVARYHAGPNNDAAQKRYVCAVIANLVASGHGAATTASTTFCR